MKQNVIYLPTPQFHGNERLINPVIKLWHPCTESRNFHCTESTGHYVHCKECHRYWRQEMTWEGSYEVKEVDGKPTAQHEHE